MIYATPALNTTTFTLSAPYPFSLDKDKLVVTVRRKGTNVAMLEYDVLSIDSSEVTVMWDSKLHKLPPGYYQAELFLKDCCVLHLEDVLVACPPQGATTSTDYSRTAGGTCLRPMDVLAGSLDSESMEPAPLEAPCPTEKERCDPCRNPCEDRNPCAK